MALWLLCGVAGAACLGQSASQPAEVDLKDSAAAGRLVAELGDRDPAVREKGQAELEALPVASLKDLQELAKDAEDAEARTRLEERVEELEGAMALNPTRLDFDFDNLSSDELAKELQRKTGVRFTWSGGSGGASGETYSLHAKGMAWDEVMAALSAQHAVAPFVVSMDVELIRPREGMPGVLWSRGAVVSLGSVRDKPGAANGEVEELQVPVSVMIDPRAKLVATRDAQVAVRFADSITRFESADGPERHIAPRGVPGWTRLYTFEVPRRLSGPLQITGEVKLTVTADDERLEIDPAKRGNEEVRFGGQLVKVTKFVMGAGSEPTWKSLAIALESRKDPESPAERIPEGMGPTDPLYSLYAGVDGSVTATVEDTKGNKFTSFYMRAGGWEGHDKIEGAFAGALKVVLTRRVAPREVVVPFEFKDVGVGR